MAPMAVSKGPHSNNGLLCFHMFFLFLVICNSRFPKKGKNRTGERHHSTGTARGEGYPGATGLEQAAVFAALLQQPLLSSPNRL